MNAVPDETDLASSEVRRQHPVEFGPKDMKAADDVFRLIVDVVVHVLSEVVDVGVDGHGLHPSGIAGSECPDIKRPQRRSVARELERPDGVVLVILAPLLHDGVLVDTQRGLILRSVASYGLPDALRMTIGSEEANRLVVAALAEFLGQPK